MKYVKMLGLLAVAAAALMAFAGSASATVTAGGSTYNGEIVATSTNTELHGSVPISCKHSEVKGHVVSGNTTGSLTSITWKECTRNVTTVEAGSLTISSDGTLTSTGAKVTVQTTILGFPVHCIYVTNKTKVGTLTEGVEPAQLHIGSAAIPQEATSGACGNDAVWTGTYTVTKPTSAIVVH